MSFYDDKVDGYAHSILVKNFSRQCLDSTKLVNMAFSYLDTVSKDKPVNVLKFYFSDKDFIPNEESQNISKINQSCLFSLILNKKSKISEFVFYNEDGEIQYCGPQWKPK